MFENDLHGTNQDHDADRLRGGVAPSRHTLGKQRYLEDKRARLNAEAAERRRIAVAQMVATAAAWLRVLANVKRLAARIVRMPRRAKGI